MPIPNTQQVAEQNLHLGAVYLYAQVQESSTLGRVTGLVNTPDSSGLMVSCIPGYPWMVRCTTGVPLGWIEDGCTFGKGINEKGDPLNGGKIETGSEVTDERQTVKGALQLTNLLPAKRIVCDGAYHDRGTGITTGGLRFLPVQNLLCIIVNRLQPEYTRLRFYTAGVFVPADEVYGYNRRAFGFEYRLKRGYKPNSTCLRDLGKLVYEWEVETFTLTETTRSARTGAIVPPASIWSVPRRVDFGLPRMPNGIGI